MNIFIFLIVCISLGMCQDLIIESSSNLDNTRDNSLRENDLIPESLLIQMRDVVNISQLFRQFVVPEAEPPRRSPTVSNGSESSFSSRNASESGRRALSAVSRSSVAQPANCQTEQHVVELDKPENGATIYWPSCVRVRRCGGCCTSSMLACKPLATSLLNVTVLQMIYNHANPNAFEAQGTRTFSIEQHDRCACTCKERAEDCNLDVHDYRANECRCVCKNAEQAASCTGPKKVWDSRDCDCKCRNVRMCSSGSYFNIINCRCDTLRRSLAVESSNPQSSNITSSFHQSPNTTFSLQQSSNITFSSQQSPNTTLSSQYTTAIL